MSKKPKNRLNRENRKKITEKTEPKKKPIKPIKFLKNPTGSVRFRFYKQKTEKTEPNQNRQKTRKKPSQTGKTEPNRKKPSQNRENRAKTGKTEPNLFEPVFALKKPNRNRSVWPGFGSVLVFFSKKNNFSLVTFFDKNRTKPKMITPNLNPQSFNLFNKVLNWILILRINSVSLMQSFKNTPWFKRDFQLGLWLWIFSMSSLIKPWA